MHGDHELRVSSSLAKIYRVNTCVFQQQTVLPLDFAVFDLHVTDQATLLSVQDLDVACQEVFPSDAQRCGGSPFDPLTAVVEIAHCKQAVYGANEG